MQTLTRREETESMAYDTSARQVCHDVGSDDVLDCSIGSEVFEYIQGIASP